MTSDSKASSAREIVWGDDSLTIRIGVDDRGRTRLLGLGANGGGFDTALPLVEIVTVDHSKQSGGRYDNTELGLELRYTEHRQSDHELEVDLRDPDSGLLATARYTMRPGSGVVSASARLAHTGSGPASVVLFVSSLALGDSTWAAADTRIHLADNDWLAEARWRSGTLAELGEPDIDMAAHFGGSPRGCLALVGRGTWSSGQHLPMGALEAPDGATVLWQVESNAGWLWQLSQAFGTEPSGVLRLVTSGPADVEHQWSVVLADGDSFTTPVTTLAWSVRGFEGALARLTDHRRASHRSFAGDAGLPVIYNDYMNTLNADPTTEKLLPLIAAVGRTGAEIFVVDAGWYSNESGWWDTVGAWEASTTRFPGGFGEVFDAIRRQALTPGLWLEPEVVGIRSPIASLLPPEAFYCRHGVRLVENGRYQLDYRHPEVISHMDAVMDRLVADYGLGYVKFDYNINPASGTTVDAESAGQGMLAASRAYLEWIDGLHARHPQLIIENCASGGMRSDWLTMSHFALLSTSDQQNAYLVPPIAASATTMVPPEMAGVWSYPQGGMLAAEAVTTLANAVMRRPILSGRIDQLDETEIGVVRDFVAAHKGIRGILRQSHSVWPLGLPRWDADWIAAGLTAPGTALLTVWRRVDESASTISIPLDRLLAGLDHEPTVEQLFPTGTPDATIVDDALHIALDAPGAVVLRFS